MSVPIIAKTCLFTLILCGILVGLSYMLGYREYFLYAGIILVIFLLMLDLFEREAARLGKKI